jgi:hypothetical protein
MGRYANESPAVRGASNELRTAAAAVRTCEIPRDGERTRATPFRVRWRAEPERLRQPNGTGTRREAEQNGSRPHGGIPTDGNRGVAGCFDNRSPAIVIADRGRGPTNEPEPRGDGAHSDDVHSWRPDDQVPRGLMDGRQRDRAGRAAQ